MSGSRVESADDMVVNDGRVPPPDEQVDGGGPEGCRHRRHYRAVVREAYREAPEGVQFVVLSS